MPAHTITITEHAFQLLMEAKVRHHEQGSMFSNTRLIHYLLEVERKLLELREKVVLSKDSMEVKAQFAMNGMTEILTYRPPVLSRDAYKPSKKASLQRRIDCTLQIEARLGIQNPPRALVNFYLDNPDQLLMRDHVLAQQARKNEIDNLKMGLPPDTPTPP